MIEINKETCAILNINNLKRQAIKEKQISCDSRLIKFNPVSLMMIQNARGLIPDFSGLLSVSASARLSSLWLMQTTMFRYKQ